MNREIKFRGKRLDNGEWVYGYYFVGAFDTHWIVTIESVFTPINKETVGQFTGLYDSTKWESLTEEEKNNFLSKGNKQKDWKGREVYEGDIISVYKDITETYSRGNIEQGTLETWEEVVSNIDIPIGVVKYIDSSFTLEEYYLDTLKEDLEVIGNIHDNPELLK